MRWRTPRCGALAEGLANERMEARSGTWIRAVCREEEPALASPPRPVRPIGSPFPGRGARACHTNPVRDRYHFTWPATPRLFSAGQGTVENFLRELVAGKARS